MKNWRSDLAAFLAGTIAGSVVLGFGGRLAMAALTLSGRNRPRFSWGGSFEVVLLGTICGAVGGLLLAAFRRRWPQAGAWRGFALGATLLGIAWAGSAVGRQTAAASPAGVLPIVSISVAVFLVYGVIADALASTWWSRIARRRP